MRKLEERDDDAGFELHFLHHLLLGSLNLVKESLEASPPPLLPSVS